MENTNHIIYSNLRSS